MEIINFNCWERVSSIQIHAWTKIAGTKGYAWDEKDNTDFTKMQSAVLYPIHVFHELTNYHNISNYDIKWSLQNENNSHILIYQKNHSYIPLDTSTVSVLSTTSPPPLECGTEFSPIYPLPVRRLWRIGKPSSWRAVPDCPPEPWRHRLYSCKLTWRQTYCSDSKTDNISILLQITL